MLMEVDTPHTQHWQFLLDVIMTLDGTKDAVDEATECDVRWRTGKKELETKERDEEDTART